MAEFAYIARDRTGLQRQNKMQADSREEVISALRGQGLLVLSVTELGGGRSRLKGISLNPLAYRSIRAQDIENNFHEIAVMLRSGISLLEALELTSKYSRIGVRRTWEKVAERIRQGGSFTEALEEHKQFTNLTVQLVKVGEQTGNLPRVMDQASVELTARRKLKKQITSAMMYPSFVLLFAIGIAIFMLVSIIPEIQKLAQLMGKKLPPITQALIDTSDWIRASAPGIAIVAATLAIVFTLLYHWPPSRWWLDYAALRIPVIGKVLRLSATVLFARAVGILLSSGVVVLDALETMENVHNNKYLASRIGEARRRVMQGSSLTEPLAEKFGYMPLLLNMMRVGENSGTLDQVLLEMTAYHEEMLERAIAKLTGMIGPAITVLVGGMVGFVYAAFLVAMFAAAGGSPS